MLLNQSSNNSDVKRSLILAGGGMRVSYQSGVLQALEEEGLSFNHVDGTSGGTINTAMLFSGVTPAEMSERWRTLKVGDFVSYLPVQQYFKPHKLKAVGDADGIIEKVFPHLGIDLEKINQSQPASQATFNVCNHSTKQNVQLTNEDVTLPHLIAGISLPIFMPAIKIAGDWFTDGVWIKDANLMEAVKRGAEELWLVWCIGNSHDYKEGSFLQYVHMIELSACGALLEEYDRILELNKRIKKGDSPYGQKNPIKLHVIKPDKPIPLDPDLYFGCINAEELINIGYQNAKSYLLHRNASGVALDWHASHMQEPGTTLITRQTLQCHFSKLAKDCRIQFRAEAYDIDVSHFSEYSHALSLFADVGLAGEFNYCSIKSGKYLLSSDQSDCPSYEMYFDSAKNRYRLVARVKRISNWSWLLFKVCELEIELQNAQGQSPLDESVVCISLLDYLKILMRIQVKNSPSIITAMKLRWIFAKWLIGKSPASNHRAKLSLSN